jgi:hypothetical protein
MLNTLLFSLLAIALFAPPVMLSKYKVKLSWWSRYSLATLPVAYTWAGWKIAEVAYGFLRCKGGTQNLQGCLAVSTELRWLDTVFLMIPCLYIAAPLSLWLLLTTVVRQAVPGSMQS